MNANELADLMDSRSVEGSQAREASALLRTIPLLQAEIDSLYYENSMLKNRHRLQKSTIEALKTKLNKAIDAEKHRRFE